MTLERSLGFRNSQSSLDANAWKNLKRHANLLLASQGLPIGTIDDPEAERLLEIASSLVDRTAAKSRLLGQYSCPIDQRIESFLKGYFADLAPTDQAWLPKLSLELDRHGVARVMSIPSRRFGTYESELLTSYRVRNGVLHNPAFGPPDDAGDLPCLRRTGCRCRATSCAVPRQDLSGPAHSGGRIRPESNRWRCRSRSRSGPEGRESGATTWVSLLLRPIVAPGVEGYSPSAYDGGPVLRSGQPGQQPGFRRVDLRERGRPELWR
jgi:hypothetical protein